MKDSSDFDLAIFVRMRAATCGDQFDPPQIAVRSHFRRIVVCIAQCAAHFGGKLFDQSWAISLSPRLAAVNSAAIGIQTQPTATAMCSFHPYHQPW